MNACFDQEETTDIYHGVTKERERYQEYHTYEMKGNPINFAICPNEKTFAILFFLQSRIKIMRLTSHNLYRLIIIDYKKYFGSNFLIQYSDDGKFIYCAYRFGKLDIYRNYFYLKIVHTLNLNKNAVLFIKQLDSRSIITGHSNGIMLTDVIQKKLIGKIQCSLDLRHQMEYDYINKIVIIQDRDKQIQFYQINGQMIINSANPHYSRIQNIFLTSENNLVSTSLDDFKLWQIDYQNKCLILLKTLEIDQPIDILLQMVDKTTFVLVQSNYMAFLDNNLIVKQRQHNFFKKNHNFGDYFKISKNYIAMFNHQAIYFIVLKKQND